MNEKQEWPNEGIHLIRTMQQHHVQLSSMADQKANMLIGAAFLVLTLSIGQSQNNAFSLPLAILALSALIAAGLAILAVMPSTAPKPAKGNNWLFFGTFAQVEETVFQEKVLSLLKEPEDMFKTMLHDIYQLGCILQSKKYRYLALAYRAFLFGLMIAFVTFVYEQIAGRLL
jgi:hypothetical protein